MYDTFLLQPPPASLILLERSTVLSIIYIRMCIKYVHTSFITSTNNVFPGFIQDVAGQMPSACAASLKRRELRAFWGETLHLATCVDPQRHPQGQPPQWRHNGVEVVMGPRKFLTWDGGLVRILRII